MEPRVLPTLALRKKRGRPPTFDPSRGWISCQITHFDAVLYSELVCLAATHGLNVDQALNKVLKAGLKAVREGQ
jgi:hypothetical protein